MKDRDIVVLLAIVCVYLICTRPSRCANLASLGAAAAEEPTSNTDKVLMDGNLLESKDIQLIPIMRPSQNMHDVLKESILLEAHLFDPERHCKDCEIKHSLKIQALLEEAVTLLVPGDPSKCLPVPTDLHELEKSYRDLYIEYYDSPRGPADRRKYGCALRQMRKELMKHYARPPCAS